MKSRRMLSAAGLALLVISMFASAPAAAQTRLSIDAGGLFPVGDMADVNAASPVVGARWEYQDVNALGNVATRTWFLRFGYGFLQEDLPQPPQDNSDGHYFDACIGARAYAQSRFSPFFMSVSGGYAQYKFPGPSDTFHGGTLNGGLGIGFPLAGFVLEVEGRGHVVFLDGADNIGFFTGIVSLGIPL